ncbi:MAG TPA: hypothetical protein VJT80_24615, partial [Steroidobacteraceae bacterium]|nr:hypothetical protein [Steroidobacteraceae bacterium]
MTISREERSLLDARPQGAPADRPKLLPERPRRRRAPHAAAHARFSMTATICAAARAAPSVSTTR